jgi:hypothetical protein
VAVEVGAEVQMLICAQALVERDVLSQVPDAVEELIALLWHSSEDRKLTCTGGAETSEELEKGRLPRTVGPD